MVDMEMPDSAEALKDFAERHALKASDLLDREELAVRSITVANAAVNACYAKLSDDDLADPAVGLILNLLHRNFELAEASILAFVTASGSASEVISRASVEASVNIGYMLRGRTPDRLLAYFDHYFRGVDRQVKAWRRETSALSDPERKLHETAAAKRQAGNDVLRKFIGEVFGAGPFEQWPTSVERRFAEVGDALSYRTFYARMSSETHGDAEETIRYFLGRVSEPEVFEAMALETVWTTRLYFYYAVSWFLRVSGRYAERYGLEQAIKVVEPLALEVENELWTIAEHVGAGLDRPETPVRQ